MNRACLMNKKPPLAGKTVGSRPAISYFAQISVLKTERFYGAGNKKNNGSSTAITTNYYYYDYCC